MVISLPILYKRDTNGKIRELTIQYREASTVPRLEPATRTVSGIMNGKLVESGWNTSEAKNEGRSNATTASEQAKKEAIAMWDKKVEKEYFEDITKVDTYDKFKPMLANDYTKKPQSSGISQPKLDGIRCIARKDGLYTRQGKDITTCDHIHDALEEFFNEYPDAILDGELYNHELKSDFNKITSLVRKIKPTEEEALECAKLVEYHIYDMAGDKPFLNRIWFLQNWHRLCNAKKKFGSPIVIVPTEECEDQESLDRLYSQYTEDGYEGQMVRNDTPYENKRSKNLLKRKEFITEEFDVVEVLEGSGNWAGYAKHFILTDGKETFKSGVRGNQETLKALLEQEKKPDWVTCRYFERSVDNIPRFPVVIDWGIGKRSD